MSLTTKLWAHAKLNCLKKKTDYLNKNDFTLNNLQRLICYETQVSCTRFVLHCLLWMFHLGFTP